MQNKIAHARAFPAAVLSPCSDIRKLDYAKRHLTSTITSLRRLAMLTAAVDDLEQVGAVCVCVCGCLCVCGCVCVCVCVCVCWGSSSAAAPLSSCGGSSTQMAGGAPSHKAGHAHPNGYRTRCRSITPLRIRHQVGYRRDQYKRCANLLEAVAQLMEHFEKYRCAPRPLPCKQSHRAWLPVQQRLRLWPSLKACCARTDGQRGWAR